jgi:DNA primase
MSLPPGFLDELRNRVSLSHVVGRKVMWDSRKSNQAKGDMWAPCPFHQEKSASFHVDDRKGFYYCFGCHAKGDAISFIRETENVEFMEAVEILAREAGLQMPARDPQAAKKADRRSQLAEVMEEAVKYYRLQLRTGVASEARAYLDRRGLDLAGQDRFEIGYAPDDRQGVFRHLTGKGIAADLVVAAGLCAEPEGGGAPYDRFRGRIMFPIRDGRGRCIAFGGRSMDPNARAKYLNSPETELFDKGHSLYNHAPAREAVGKGQPLIVAEGYMDVIALSLAGFGGAVAPLGTAITPGQLELMWRISPEPVIALDGDKAGLRAAYRLIDVALPLLETGRALRFCLMPEGQDPDDLIKAKGAGAMKELLEGAMPLVSLLWQRATEGQVFDSPERKAMLDKRLRDEIGQIKDPSLKGHYGEEIKELRWTLFRGNRAGGNQGARPAFQPGARTGGRGGRWQPAPVPLASTKLSPLVAGDEDFQVFLREGIILATLIANPGTLERFAYILERMECRNHDLRCIRDALLDCETDCADLRAEVAGRIGHEALENLFAQRHITICPSVRQAGDQDIAVMTLAEEAAKLTAQRGLMAEIDEASEELSMEAGESVTWRLGQAALTFDRATRAQQEDTAEYETAPNGVRINRDEKDAFADLLARLTKTGKD